MIVPDHANSKVDKGEEMNKSVKKGVLLLASLAGLGIWAGTAFAYDGKPAKEPALAPGPVAERPTADGSVGLYSKYVWRGFELSRDSLVIQPSVTVGYKGFSVNFWSNLDTDLHEELRTDDGSRFNLNETDITLAYERSVGLAVFSAGYIYYDLDGAIDAQELFLRIGLDTLLSPSLTVYREFAHAPAWYINFGISRSVPLISDIALDLGASAGYLDDNESGRFHDGLLSAAITYPITEYMAVTPELYYSFALSNKAKELIREASVSGDDNFIYGGVSVSFSF
jgi:hypothetical protein